MINKVSVTEDLIQNLSDVLLAKGWEIRNSGKKFTRYVYQTYFEDYEESVEILLPKSIHVFEAEPYTNLALDTASKVHRVSFDEMLRIVTFLWFDSFSFRFGDGKDVYDSLRLDYASNSIFSVFQLLKSTAAMEEMPAALSNKRTGAVENYVRSCRIGHTFKGSFGFRINTPLPRYQNALFSRLKDDHPFERRTIERLFTGFDLLTEAEKYHDTDVFVQDYEKGWNATICDDMVQFHRKIGKENIKFDFDLSPVVKTRIDTQRNRSFVIRPRLIEIAEEASAKMKKLEREYNAILQGPIINLHRETVGPLFEEWVQEEGGDITIKSEHHKYGEIKVVLRLDANQYDEAIKKHRKGELIRARGTLERRGQRWHLVDCSEIS